MLLINLYIRKVIGSYVKQYSWDKFFRNESFGEEVGLVVLFLAISIAFFALWIAMLVDCAKRKFKKVDERVLWFLILAIFGAVGAVVYYFAVKRNKNYKCNK